MPPDPPGGDEPRLHAVRLSEPAEAEIEAAYLRLMGATSLEFADRWQDGLFRAVNDPSLFPMSHQAVPGTEHPQSRMPTRRMIYRQGRLIYRVFFDVMDEDDDGQTDTVVVQHVRHGAQQDVPPEGDPEQ